MFDGCIKLIYFENGKMYNIFALAKDSLWPLVAATRDT